IMFTLEMAGIPFAAGGSSRVVDAFRTLIESSGGVLRTDADVTRVVIESGRAVAVEAADGGRVAARQAGVCNGTPTPLYRRLLSPAAIPNRIAARAPAFTYGPAALQIHRAPPPPP